MTAIRGAILWAVTAVLLAHAAAYAQSATGAIRGQVLDSNGRPAINVRVSALELPDAKGLSARYLVSVGTTDAEGRYLLSDVPPGRYGVFTNIPSVYYVTTQDLESAPIVTVRSGKDSVRDISLPPPPQGFNVSGRIHRVPGSSDADVILTTANSFLRIKVAVDGTFVFRNVSAGTYRISVSEVRFAWGSRDIRIEDRDLDGIELFPDEIFPVSGRVTTKGKGPVPAFSLLLEGSQGPAITSHIWVLDTLRSSGMIGVSGWTDRPDDVLFSAGLPIGEYRISVTGLPPGFRVKSFSYGTTNLLEKPLKLAGAIDQFSIELSPPESLKLVRISGRLIRDVPLGPEFESDSFILTDRRLLIPLETVIGRDGSFEISGVPPGLYDVSSPRFGLRLSVGSVDVRGIELRTSEVQSRLNAAVRAASNPPERVAEVVDEIRNAETPIADEPVRPRPVEHVRVRGRVTGSRDATEVVLQGDTSTASDLDGDGRFEFLAVPSGIYTIFSNPIGTPRAYSAESRTLVVRDADVEGVEVRGLPLKSRITGRIIVEGGFPLPSVALTVRPNVNSGPPFGHPFTLRSGLRGFGSFTVQSDGRFTFDLPDGLHRLRVDGPWGYRVKSVTYGSASLKDGHLKIDKANLKELVVTFSTVPDAFATTVRGKVEGMANASEGVRVMLSGNRTGIQLEAVPNPDGTFEFAKVPVDKYSMRLMPLYAATSTKTIEVAGRGDTTVSLSIPAQQNVAVRFATTGGTTPPNMTLGLTLSPTEAYSVLSVPLVMRTAGEWICPSDACYQSYERTVGGPTVVPGSKSAGGYTLRLPEGEYRVDVPAPAGYEVVSIVAGETDLRQAPLRVAPGGSQEIVVNLGLK